MRTSLVVALASAALLAGCAQQMLYVRYDGQRTSGDPILHQQFEQDAAICQGQMQRANVSGVTFTGGGMAGVAASVARSQAVGQVAEGCMAEKGYALVQADQVDAKLAEFAAVAEEKKKREAALQAPPPASSKKRAPTTTAQAQR